MRFEGKKHSTINDSSIVKVCLNALMILVMINEACHVGDTYCLSHCKRHHTISDWSVPLVRKWVFKCDRAFQTPFVDRDGIIQINSINVG